MPSDFMMRAAGSARSVDRWLEQQGRSGRRADLHERIGAKPTWWVARADIDLALVLRITEEIEQNGAVVVLAGQRPRLGQLERLLTTVACHLLPEGSAETDAVALHLLPDDGWCLPALRALGFTLDVKGELPPRGTARLRAHRGVIEALAQEVLDVDVW